MALASGKSLFVLGLAGLVSVGASFAEDTGRAEPSSRTERFEVLRMREYRQGMLASDEAKPVEEAALRLTFSDTPSAPDSFNMDAFVRFLRNAVKMSYNKPYKDAYNVLKTAITNARKVATPPMGIDLCLVGAQNAGFKADRYDDAWEILHTALKAISDTPDAFVGEPAVTFRNVLQLGRQASWDKTYKNAHHTIDQFLRSLKAHPELFADRYHALAVDAAVASGEAAGEWDDAWSQQDHSMKILAESDGSDPRLDYLKAALNGHWDSNGENGYNHLRIFAQTLIGDAVVDPFDKVTLETALSAAYEANRYAVARALLRDAFTQLSGS